MSTFEKAKNVEDLFKELDEHEFAHIAKPLASYRNELMREGFTRRETMRLVEAYSKFVYDVAIENVLEEKRLEAMAAFDEECEEEFDDVDSSSDSEED